MPKIEHEFLTELFQNDPDLVVELVKQEAGERLPHFTKVTLQSNRVNRLEDIVSAKTYGFTSPFTERYVEQGRADATARMILKILRSRRIETDTTTRERITACTDLDTLDHWADRAFTVSSAQELFD
ncbi:hypothetical protein O4J56_01950 [Nocardiopsis sp. RSe5-2]|uniref:Uncharacterized protein n=1 Tax=Nocardiopsis endophytica TaxID=3018445 RepID=A0ABT4TXI1_9ACTN|nr:hypothetical protein [Nocardiopsis endophytica]MDA2809388.1 hypothetical protein [Nocardiopsis endophytica]